MSRTSGTRRRPSRAARRRPCSCRSRTPPLGRRGLLGGGLLAVLGAPCANPLVHLGEFEFPEATNFVSWQTSGLDRSEEHTSELQSRENLVCRLLLEKKK